MVVGMKSSQGAYSGMQLGETKVLLSNLVCSIANAAIAFGFTTMYTTTRKKKTMGGHLEKRICEHIMAIFVIII